MSVLSECFRNHLSCLEGHISLCAEPPAKTTIFMVSVSPFSKLIFSLYSIPFFDLMTRIFLVFSKLCPCAATPCFLSTLFRYTLTSAVFCHPQKPQKNLPRNEIPPVNHTAIMINHLLRFCSIFPPASAVRIFPSIRSPLGTDMQYNP